MIRTLTGITATAVILAGLVSVAAQSRDAEVTAFFKAYDAAFNAKDLQRLATMYHADVKLVALDEPPSRFAAGADAVQTFEAKANTRLAQARAHHELSTSLALEDA